MPAEKDRPTISVNQKAYDRLLKAKKRGESLSDVIVRLSEAKVTALQRRGEKEIVTSDSKKLIVEIDQDKCAGAESCVSVAPTIFALDLSELGGFRRDGEPLGMKEVEDRTVDSDTIITAAKSCPYHSIYVKDLETGSNWLDDSRMSNSLARATFSILDGRNLERSRATLSRLEGIHSVGISVLTQMVYVEYDPREISPAKIRSLLNHR